MQYDVFGGGQTQGVLWTAHTLPQAAHTLATPLLVIPKRSHHLGTRFDVVDIGECLIMYFSLSFQASHSHYYQLALKIII